MINRDNYMKASIDDWSKEFIEIYGHKDMLMDEEAMWLHVVEDMSDVAEALRKDKYKEATKPLLHVFCWVSCFISHFIGRLNEVLWDKYPAVCPVCVTKESNQLDTCKCPTKYREVEEAKDKGVNEEVLTLFREKINAKPKTINEWTSMFDTIYGSKISHDDVSKICFHLMEEIGEVSKSLRKKKNFVRSMHLNGLSDEEIKKGTIVLQKKLEYELADTISWTFSLANKIFEIQKDITGIKPNISKELYEEYKDGCSLCGKKPCECRPTELWEL